MKRIAIIGGGFTGLTAAYDLRKMGYRVTLFESKKELGGLLTHGFPSYRLPREVVERDLGIINKMGIEIKFNTEVGKDVSSETLRQSYDAIFIAGGIAGTEPILRAFEGLKRTRRGRTCSCSGGCRITFVQITELSLQRRALGIG